MNCEDCSENLDDVPIGDPCPACGGSRRSATVQVGTIEAVAAVGQVSLAITKDDHRPWTEKWLAVLDYLAKVSEAYSGTARFGNTEVDNRVNAFFVECHHFPEWLKRDVYALPQQVTRKKIDEHAYSSDPLKLCNAISNTHKHHTRHPGETPARIRNTALTPNGARVTIEIGWADSEAMMVDALELASDCVASWRAFFDEVGIDEP